MILFSRDFLYNSCKKRTICSASADSPISYWVRSMILPNLLPYVMLLDEFLGLYMKSPQNSIQGNNDHFVQIIYLLSTDSSACNYPVMFHFLLIE